MPRFLQIFDNAGVDQDAGWMMVPHGGYNLVLLADAKDMSVHPSNGRIDLTEVNSGATSGVSDATAKIKKDKGDPAKLLEAVKLTSNRGARLFMVRGPTEGDATITVKNGKTNKTTLSVSVMKPKSFKLSFHFLSHVDPSTKVETPLTRWKTDRADHWLTVMNDIWLPQTNIAFVKEKAKSVPLDKEWQSIPHYERDGSETDIFKLVVSKKDPDADTTIFLIKDFRNAANLRDSGPNGRHIGKHKVIFCDDIVKEEQGITLAHEVGHALGLSDLKGEGKLHLLMFNDGTPGKKIRAHEVKEARKHAK
jgi:hypothetical protein